MGNRRFEFNLAYVVIIVTVTAYLVMLGWHQLQQYQSLEGLDAGRRPGRARGRPRTARIRLAGRGGADPRLAMVWSADASNSPVDGANMRLAGAFFVLIGTDIGALAVSGLAAVLRRLLDDRKA